MVYASSFLVRLLQSAGVEPRRLDRAMSARVRHRLGHMVETDHFPRLIARNSGIVITRLRRRSGYLLMEATSRTLRYAELGKSECLFMCEGELPETAQAAAVGRRLDEVVGLGGPAAAYGPFVIRSPATAWEGGIGFEVEPDWVGIR